MKRLVFPVLLTVAGLLTASCAEDGSTGPSPFPVQLMCPEFGESARCVAWATVGGRDGQDVSGLATWSTSDPTIATINTTGLVTALRSGEVAIRVSYLRDGPFTIRLSKPGYRTAEYQWSIPGGAERIPTLTASQQDR